LLFDDKQKAKQAYKNKIAFYKKSSSNSLSSSLQDNLLNNEQQLFWGCLLPPTPLPPLPPERIGQTAALQKRLDNYVGARCNYDSIVSLNVFDKLVANLPTKKSPCFDLLSAEHLKYSPSIILKIIRLFFSFIVSNKGRPL